MRRLAVATLILGGLTGLMVAVPRWTAAQAEAGREAALRNETRKAVLATLPVCPYPGPERDAFLQQAGMVLKDSAELWRPVCRVESWPDGRILVLSATRGDFRACTESSQWRPVNVLCGLEEPLAFLADSRLRRTWARQESNGTIWLTSHPLAWNDQLVIEHREWMAGSLLGLAIAASLLWCARRARQASGWRQACHRDGDPDLPPHAEFLLHWVLGQRCGSLPGDLSEEYADLLGQVQRTSAGWTAIHRVAPNQVACDWTPERSDLRCMWIPFEKATPNAHGVPPTADAIWGLTSDGTLKMTNSSTPPIQGDSSRWKLPSPGLASRRSAFEGSICSPSSKQHQPHHNRGRSSLHLNGQYQWKFCRGTHDRMLDRP